MAGGQAVGTRSSWSRRYILIVERQGRWFPSLSTNIEHKNPMKPKSASELPRILVPERWDNSISVPPTISADHKSRWFRVVLIIDSPYHTIVRIRMPRRRDEGYGLARCRLPRQCRSGERRSRENKMRPPEKAAATKATCYAQPGGWRTLCEKKNAKAAVP